jgi:hypothetical protein
MQRDDEDRPSASDRPRQAVHTTIVGGQPPGNTRELPPIPVGIEQLLGMAAVNPDFARALAADRAAAIGASGVALTATERGILDAIDAPALALLVALMAGCGSSHLSGDGDASPGADAVPCAESDRCGDECCGDGQTCLDSGCCDDADVCGDVCCAAGTLCQAGQCRLDCGGPLPCGAIDAEVCCDSSEVCYQGECLTPGAACDDIYDCGGAAYCEPTVNQCLPVDPEQIDCFVPPPPPGEFQPTIAWKWTGSTVAPAWNQVMMMPAIANLTDDNLDGAIDERDSPDIVFHTFAGSNYGADGIMRAVHGATGVEIWSASDAALRVVPGSAVAIGDIDLDDEPEILACGTAAGGLQPLLAFEHDGTLKWATTDPAVVCGYAGPAIANLDQVGPPEILVRYTVVDADGSVRWAKPGGHLYSSFYDIDDNGFLDVVGGNVAYDKDGVELWSRAGDYGDGFHAIADLDGDHAPDVVLVNSSAHLVMAFRGSDGADLWPAPQDVNQGVATPEGPVGGGPPTISDFDGDKKPEIAVAGGYGYVVFEGESGAPKWFRSTIDLSSRATGSSVFDFEDDGIAEVLYADERQLHVYRGTDGAPLLTMCNSSGTLWEYPLVVDVDNDERAEIVVARNNYAFPTCLDGTPADTGIAVIEDALDNWVRTRRIWNQHTYHVTNVNEDASIPPIEADNWQILGLNDFRQNVQPIAVPAAPDLVITSIGADLVDCPVVTIEALVENRGDAGAPAGVPVAFYDGLLPSPTLIGVTLTTAPILPGQSMVVGHPFTVPDERLGEVLVFYAAVDDDGSGATPGAGTGSAPECEEENNVSEPEITECSQIE